MIRLSFYKLGLNICPKQDLLHVFKRNFTSSNELIVDKLDGDLEGKSD